jgi:hypothetical protein
MLKKAFFRRADDFFKRLHSFPSRIGRHQDDHSVRDSKPLSGCQVSDSPSLSRASSPLRRCHLVLLDLFRKPTAHLCGFQPIKRYPAECTAIHQPTKTPLYILGRVTSLIQEQGFLVGLAGRLYCCRLGACALLILRNPVSGRFGGFVVLVKVTLAHGNAVFRLHPASAQSMCPRHCRACETQCSRPPASAPNKARA